MIAQDLTRQARASDATGGEDLLFGDGRPVGLAGDELDTAGGASCVASARMQHVNTSILLDRKDQALTRLHVNGRKPFNGQFRHAPIIFRSGDSTR